MSRERDLIPNMLFENFRKAGTAGAAGAIIVVGAALVQVLMDIRDKVGDPPPMKVRR